MPLSCSAYARRKATHTHTHVRRRLIPDMVDLHCCMHGWRTYGKQHFDSERHALLICPENLADVYGEVRVTFLVTEQPEDASTASSGGDGSCWRLTFVWAVNGEDSSCDSRWLRATPRAGLGFGPRTGALRPTFLRRRSRSTSGSRAPPWRRLRYLAQRWRPQGNCELSLGKVP